jgi:16S rRNA (guanine527-N7)-methyltransferase
VTDSAALAAALDAYAGELVRWGARMNLVGSTDREALERHFEDSLAAAAELPAGATVVDLGSGAGFPGIPIALARPDLALTLVEIREKRVAFLRHAARVLALRIEILAVSIDAPPPRSFSFALLRAVAKPARSLELALPWLEPTGEAWIWAGPSEDLPSACPLALRSGGRILRVRASDFSRGTT